LSNRIQKVQIEPLQSDNASATTGNCVHTKNSKQTHNPVKLTERNDLGKYVPENRETPYNIRRLKYEKHK
jgi:hypothetical protein